METKDKEEWDSFVFSLEPRFQDVFLLCGYACAYEKIYQGKANLVYLKNDNDFLFYIFFRRPVSKLSFYQDKRELFDIISAEYSGPILRGDEKILHLFSKEFRNFCVNEGIVSEFCRFNPYYNCEQFLLDFFSAELNRQIVYIDLLKDEKDIFKGFSKGNRSSIKKAIKEGVVIKEASVEYIEDFFSLYTQTMQRNNAKKFYYFSLEFFKDLFSFLKGNITLFLAIFKGKIISAAIFLYLGYYIHYYFSGSDQRYLYLCPNNLLLFEVTKWAKAKGFRIFNLGGGYHFQGKDSLFQFKSSFSPLRANFYIYKKIHIPELYEALCNKFMIFNNLNKKDLEGNTFFPLYRSLD